VAIKALDFIEARRQADSFAASSFEGQQHHTFHPRDRPTAEGKLCPNDFSSVALVVKRG
jgi:hypothetical protein